MPPSLALWENYTPNAPIIARVPVIAGMLVVTSVPIIPYMPMVTNTGGIFCGQRVAVSEPVVRKINICPSVSFLRLFYLKIQLEIDFHPLF